MLREVLSLSHKIISRERLSSFDLTHFVVVHTRSKPLFFLDSLEGFFFDLLTQETCDVIRDRVVLIFESFHSEKVMK